MDVTPTVSPDAELSVIEAATLAGVSTRTIRRAISEGKLPRTYISTAHGAQLSLPHAAIHRWLQERVEDGELGHLDTSLSIGQATPDVATLLASLFQQQVDSHRQVLASQFRDWEVRQRETLAGLLSAQQQPLVERLDSLQQEVLHLRQALAAAQHPKRPWWKFWT